MGENPYSGISYAVASAKFSEIYGIEKISGTFKAFQWRI